MLLWMYCHASRMAGLGRLCKYSTRIVAFAKRRIKISMKAKDKRGLPPAVQKFCDSLEQMIDQGSAAVTVNRQEMERLTRQQNFQKDVLCIRKNGIPPNGFNDVNQMNEWLTKTSRFEPEKYSIFRDQVDILIANYARSENFADAIICYVLRGVVGHIQGNATISVDFENNNKVSIETLGRLTKGEGVSAMKVSNALNDLVKPHKRQNKKTQQDRDLRYLQATTGKIEKDLGGEELSISEVKRRQQSIKTGRHRLKKRLK